MIFDWISQHTLQLLITGGVLAIYVALDRFSKPKLQESVDLGKFKTEAGTKAIRVARVIIGATCTLILVLVWGIDLNALLFFATTTITLMGVALFANWSILSNITAYFVLLLQPSFMRGNFIRIVEADNYIEGHITDLNLFHTKLVTENHEVIVYPNNLLLGRACLINPNDRLDGIGKISKLPIPPATPEIEKP